MENGQRKCTRIPAFKSQVLRQYQEKRINSFTHYFNKYLNYILGSLLNRILRIKSSVLKDSLE